MTTSKTEAHDTRGLSGWHVLGAMLTFFAVIIVADATMIYKAVSTFGGVDNANAYRDGLAYNQRIASETRQATLGWNETVELLVDPARLRVSLRDAGGQPPANVRVEATLGRPATITSDTQVRFAEVSPGLFEAAIGERIEPGTWIATVRAFRNDTMATEPAFQIRRRLWVAP
jgi:nitrogen fixation protein FixH